MTRRPYTDDGVQYEYVPCVRCNEKMAVASAALLVADRKVWPVCGQCSNEPDALGKDTA